MNEIPDVQGIDALARHYATTRQRREALEAASEESLQATPEWVALREAQLAADAAADALDARKRLDARAQEAAALFVVEAEAEAALLSAWGPALKQGLGKTVDLPVGRVQVRVSERVAVTDSEALARDLLAKGLFGAGIKELKVDAKLLRPLLDRGALQGVEARDALSIAFAPKRGS